MRLPKSKKFLFLPAIILVFLVALALNTSGRKKNIISKELGLDVSGGTELFYSDDHGGFHNDGTTYLVMSFSDSAVLEQIKQSPHWSAFPLNETVKTLVYGSSNESGHVGPYLTDTDGQNLLPYIQNGYYLLIDRQTDSLAERQGKNTTSMQTDLLHRGSFNFTLGIYDTDSNRLYFCKFDT